MSHRLRNWQVLVFLNMMVVVGLVVATVAQGTSLAELWQDPVLLVRDFKLSWVSGGG